MSEPKVFSKQIAESSRLSIPIPVATLTLAQLPPAKETEKSQVELKKDINEFWSSHDPREQQKSIEQIEKLKQKYPGSNEVLRNEGLFYLAYGDTEKAQKVFQQILDTEPKNILARYLNALCLKGLAKNEDDLIKVKAEINIALANAKESIQVNQNHKEKLLEIYFHQTIVLQLDERQEEAKNSFLESEKIYDSYLSDIKEPRTNQRIQETITLQKSRYYELINLGVIENPIEQLLAVDTLIIDKIGDEQNTALAHLERASLYMKAKKFDLALIDFRILEKGIPDSIDLQLNIANCHFMQGELEESIKIVEKALQSVPNNIKALEKLAMYYYEDSDYNKMEETYSKLISLEAKPEYY
nr:tetratricopeptide repeat protein [Pseudomonadota bacterium]